MEKQFVTYEIAKELKDLGFNEPCLAQFLTEYSTDEGVLYPTELSCCVSDDFDKNGNPAFQTIKNSDFIDVPQYLAAPLWQQAIEFLNRFSEKAHKKIKLRTTFTELVSLEMETIKYIMSIKETNKNETLRLLRKETDQE